MLATGKWELNLAWTGVKWIKSDYVFFSDEGSSLNHDLLRKIRWSVLMDFFLI